MTLYSWVAVAALWQVADAGKDFSAEYEALDKSYKEARDEFFASLMKSKADGEGGGGQVDWTKNPVRDFIEKYQEFAERAKGTELAARAWLQVAEMGPQAGNLGAAKEAVETLVAEYVESPVLADLAEQLRSGAEWMLGRDKAETSLRTIAERSPHAAVQASALLTLGSLLSTDRKERHAEAKTLLQLVKRKYRDTAYAKDADAEIFVLENLQVGMAAPDFTATDQNGATFKLSEYRGKVVVLDFWGFW